jgi:hypothetical protein
VLVDRKCLNFRINLEDNLQINMQSVSFYTFDFYYLGLGGQFGVVPVNHDASNPNSKYI